MKNVNVSADKHSFPELISQVTERGERIVVEQEGKAIAAIITYADLKRFEALETLLLKKAELEEYEWLKNWIKNPAFDALNDPEEDIYTIADGKPFHDPEWSKIATNDPDFSSPTDPEEDIYTLADGKPFHDEG
jgi:PHD/YefM family antitoxin component YafN of YafNO toxin-antitoxin module